MRLPDPAIGDPVVVGGRKYRIKRLSPADSGLIAELATSFGGWTATAPADELLWDRAAGVWRWSE